MTYRSPENLIRSIMAKSNLTESKASDNMNPALKTPEEERLTHALNILKNFGCPSAKIEGNSISVAAGEMEMAADVLERATAHGLITVRPELSSPEAIPMPEPHVPAPEFAKEEEIVLTTTSREKSEVDRDINNIARDIMNKKTQKEEVEQVDELSTETLKKVANAARKKGRPDVLKSAIKAHQRNRALPQYEGPPMAKHEETEATGEQQLDELSFRTIVRYAKAAKAPLNPLSKKIDHRRKGLNMAEKQKKEKISKAAFGEGAALEMIKRVRTLAESRGERLKATINSDCGNHHAKIYRDSEWNTHRVKFFINGKHHEPADYETNDYDDAHGTAKLELHRLSKLNGALKESTIEEVQAVLEDEQIDELSKALLGRYITKAKASAHAHDVMDNMHQGLAKRQHDEHDWQAKKHMWKAENRRQNIEKAEKKLAREEVAKEGEVPFLIERLGPGASASDWIHDFVHSKNPKFKGKSKKERIKMALGAYYGSHNESISEEQIDEISSDLAHRYLEKAIPDHADRHYGVSSNLDGRIKATSLRRQAKNKMENGATPKEREEGRQEWKTHLRKIKNRNTGIDRAISRIKEEVEQLDELVKVGAYTNDHGAALSIHRHPNDPKHHFISHKGKVVDYHYGKASDLHKKLTKDGFKGTISEDLSVKKVDDNEITLEDPKGDEVSALRKKKDLDKVLSKIGKAIKEEQIDELSANTLTKYAVKASKSKQNLHVSSMKKYGKGDMTGGMHDTFKRANRANGIRKAVDKIASKAMPVGIAEEEQEDENS